MDVEHFGTFVGEALGKSVEVGDCLYCFGRASGFRELMGGSADKVVGFVERSVGYGMAQA